MFIIDYSATLFGAMFFSGWVGAILSLVFIVALIIEIARDEYVLGYFSFVIYLLLTWLFTPLNPFAYIWHNPLEVLGFVLLYFAIGAVYSTIKYRAWAVRLIDDVREIKLKFIEKNELKIGFTDEIPAHLEQVWSNMLYKELSYDEFNTLKEGFGPGKHKAEIMNWISFWPFSAIGLFVADPLEKFVLWVYESLVSVYQGIWNRVIASRINISDVKNIKSPDRY